MGGPTQALPPRKTQADCPDEDPRIPNFEKDYLIPVVYESDHLWIVDKPYDLRIDGNFDNTVEKFVQKRNAPMDKFHWLFHRKGFHRKGFHPLLMLLLMMWRMATVTTQR